ncbi:glycosyltransferase [Flammeovirga yaeyamensis]|uniref:Glycosyltransferase n=1 Tax=Flammeovirga yaeyamensis TaxID=367791 RepID=A0AAX1N203_9BACT|nr:glycosyltransferase family 4 protein [Flammeovirga yaeyamensis]MBB3696340.1 glycosyltransferase involved in cell wall biosynthesis [Flammeovirga yaeyamensis]NMF35019.1 glycosyltransferase family 4 protein [Flammeovirga yaeyamensis]QWG00155.1 glycosyltransferase [Flammeovirga yaeyamensis]
MRILFIQKVKGLAGSEKYFLEMLPALMKKGIHCEFVSVRMFNDNDKPLIFIKSLRKLGIKTYDLSFKNSYDYRIIKNLSEIIKENSFDIIHSHLIHADIWCSIYKIFSRNKIPLVSTKHGYDEKYINKYGFKVKINYFSKYYLLALFCEKFIDRSFAVSNGIKQLFTGLKISSENKIDVIHHGFLYEDLKQTNSKQEYQLLVVGRLIPFKGHRYLIESIAELIDFYPKIKLLILGSGPEKISLKKITKKFNVEKNVIFTGFDSNVNKYLCESQILVVPSISEGFGLVFLEGYNAKIPIIAFDVPASNEIIINNETGILVKPYSTKDLTVSIKNLFNNSSEQKRLATNGYKRLKEYFNIERMVNETISFYKNVLNL